MISRRSNSLSYTLYLIVFFIHSWKINLNPKKIQIESEIKHGSSFALFNCAYNILRSMFNFQLRLTVNSLWFHRRYFVPSLSLYFLFLSITFSISLPLRLSLSIHSWSGVRIRHEKLERKINRNGNAHVHIFIHCLLKCQYQYLDRMKWLFLYFVAVYVSFDGETKCILTMAWRAIEWLQWASSVRLVTVFWITCGYAYPITSQNKWLTEIKTFSVFCLENDKFALYSFVLKNIRWKIFHFAIITSKSFPGRLLFHFEVC